MRMKTGFLSADSGYQERWANANYTNWTFRLAYIILVIHQGHTRGHIIRSRDLNQYKQNSNSGVPELLI